MHGFTITILPASHDVRTISSCDVSLTFLTRYHNVSSHNHYSTFFGTFAQPT